MRHVVLTGTESTYKTRLCEALSEWLNIRAVPEYARKYMRENRLGVTALNEAVFTTIATGQIEQQRSNGYYDVHAAPVLFDTDGITLAIWAEDKFQLVDEPFSVVPQHLHYLLCAPTNKAYKDVLREDLTRRDELHKRYINMLDAVNASYTILNEVAFEDRLLEAKSALKSWGFTPRD
jgi:nicotinamide riboside kinase